jgi:hypothetical protein
MSTWRPPWSAQGQFAVTLLPATRASNSVTARPPPRPGSTAALRAGSRDPAPRDLPADLGWPGGCQPAHPCQAMSTATRVPETHELEGNDALNALQRTGRGRLAKNSFQRFHTAHSLRQPRTAEGFRTSAAPQARGAVDTRDCGSASATTVAGELAAAVLVVDEWAEPQRPCSFIGRGQAGSRLFPRVGPVRCRCAT